MAAPKDPEFIRHLEFDSQVLGIPTARLTYDGEDEEMLLRAMKECEERGIELLFWTAPSVSPSIEAMCKRDGHFIDGGRVVYSGTWNTEDICSLQSAFSSSEVSVEKFTGSEVTHDLRSLAILAGVCSRFSMDPKIKKTQMEALYGKWIENIVSGAHAHESDPTNYDPTAVAHVMFVATHPSGKQVGFVALKVCGEVMKGSLMSVSPAFQGCRIGTGLVAKCIQWGQDHGLTRCEIITQGQNTPARKVYQKFGFSHTDVVGHDIHFWVKQPPSGPKP